MAIINFNSISGINTISVASSITVGTGVTITATSITSPTFIGNVNSTSGVTTVTTLNATTISGVSTAGITTVYVSSVNEGPISGFRNRLINGNFEVWQRGTSFTNMVEATTYTADRWSCYRDVYASGITVSQVSGISQNGINRNAIRVQRTAGNTSTAAMNITQSIESINSRDLAGQNVTLSFWARCGANYSSSGNVLSMIIGSGTGTDQASRQAITGYTSLSSNCTLTTTFQRFSLTRTIPSNANQIFVHFISTPTGTAGAADSFDIMDVQLEQGTVATPIENRLYGQEIVLCQRYYETGGGVVNAYYSAGSFGGGLTQKNFAVLKRNSPTIAITSGSGSGSTPIGAPSLGSFVYGFNIWWNGGATQGDYREFTFTASSEL